MEEKMPGDALGVTAPRLASVYTESRRKDSSQSGRPRLRCKMRIFVIAITSRVQSAALTSNASIVNVTFDGSS
jgi:hypothetical protein